MHKISTRLAVQGNECRSDRRIEPIKTAKQWALKIHVACWRYFVVPSKFLFTPKEEPHAPRYRRRSDHFESWYSPTMRLLGKLRRHPVTIVSLWHRSSFSWEGKGFRPDQYGLGGFPGTKTTRVLNWEETRNKFSSYARVPEHHVPIRDTMTLHIK